MNPCRVWVRMGLPDALLEQLRSSFPGCTFERATDAEIDGHADVDVLFTNEPVPNDVVERMGSLQWLHTTYGGAGRFLVPAVRQRPILLTTSKDLYTVSFAEFAMGIILALAKEVPQMVRAQSERRWMQANPPLLAGRTLCVVGLGTIGRGVAERAALLGMRVVATKRVVDGKPGYVDEVASPEQLPRLLAQSDFVVLCPAGIPANEWLIGEAELRAMKDSAYLINIVPLRAVNEQLLARALREGRIAGAALDLAPHHALAADSELWNAPNLLLTACVSGVQTDRWESYLDFFKPNLTRFLAGEPLAGLVDKEKGY